MNYLDLENFFFSVISMETFNRIVTADSRYHLYIF